MRGVFEKPRQAVEGALFDRGEGDEVAPNRGFSGVCVLRGAGLPFAARLEFFRALRSG